MHILYKILWNAPLIFYIKRGDSRILVFNFPTCCRAAPTRQAYTVILFIYTTFIGSHWARFARIHLYTLGVLNGKSIIFVMLLTATSPIWCPDIITYIIPVCCIFLTHNTTGTFSVYFTSIICPIPHAGVKDFILILYLFKTPDIPTNHLIVRLNTIARRQAGAKIRAFATGRIIQIALYKSPFTGARGRQAFARAKARNRKFAEILGIRKIQQEQVEGSGN